jgi:hypothetical protein
MPFGTEYKLKLKNKKGTRCMVEVSIDGTDVLFGRRLILNAYESMDLERFLDNNNSGASFKFMSVDQAASTGELQDPDSPDNGHIQVRFYEEKQVSPILYALHTVATPFWGGGYINNGGGFIGGAYHVSSNLNANTSGGGSCGSTFTTTGAAGVTGQGNPHVTHTSCAVNSRGMGEANSTCDSFSGNLEVNNSAGVTGQGGVSNQQFTDSWGFPTQAYPTTIDIWLSGPITIPAPQPHPRYRIVREGQVHRVYRDLNGLSQQVAFKSFTVDDNGLTIELGEGGKIGTQNFEFVG